jgi:hypothetical protein
MKKKSFILFEVLIAFVIVLLCAVPLVKQPLKLYRSELIFLEQMERERLADWTFTEIKEKLLKNEIPWEKIPPKGSESTSIPLPSAFIRIPGSNPKEIERTFRLKCKGEKKGTQEELYRSLLIEIDFSPRLSSKQKSYPFRLIVRRLPAAPIHPQL